MRSDKQKKKRKEWARQIGLGFVWNIVSFHFNGIDIKRR